MEKSEMEKILKISVMEKFKNILGTKQNYYCKPN